MKVVIEDGCIGCELCVQTCEKVFRMNDDGLAEVYGEVTADLEQDVADAAESCPVAVIHIED